MPSTIVWFLQVEQLYTEKLYQLYTRKLYFIEFFQKNAQNEPQIWPYFMKLLRKRQNKAVFWPKNEDF